MTPLVSILIPCHNAAPYIGAALDSALAQTWKNLEIIVVDDESTDGSREVLERFREVGVQIVVPETPLRSAGKARNLAVAESHGDYVKFFDADDLLHPEMVERQLAALAGSVKDVASSEWGRFYGDDFATFRPSPQTVWRDMDAREWLVEALMDARPMMQVGMFLIPRTLAAKAGPWKEYLSPCDDFEYFSRLFCMTNGIRFASGSPLYYRSGIAASLSKKRSRDAVDGALRSLIEGTNCLLGCRRDLAARAACANTLQDFIYSYYPENAHLIQAASKRVRELGGSHLNPDGPPRFHQLRSITGWKIARRIQRWARG